MAQIAPVSDGSPSNSRTDATRVENLEGFGSGIKSHFEDFVESASGALRGAVSMSVEDVTSRADKARDHVMSIADTAARADHIKHLADLERGLMQKIMADSGMGRAAGGKGNVIDGWYRTLSAKVLIHDYYYVLYSRISMVLTITIIVLNAVVSALVFSGGNSGNEQEVQMVSGGVSTTVTVLTALTSRLKFGELSERHLSSKRGFVRLKRRVDVLRDVRKLPVVAPDDCKEPGVIPGKMYPD